MPLPASAYAEEPLVRFIRRACLVAGAVLVPLALVSGYRAIWQIYSVEIAAAEEIRAGAAVEVTVVTSGRTYADVQLDLVQHPRAESLTVLVIPGNGDGAMDPRPRRATLRVVLTPELLARFEPGVARLRATAHGRSQFMRVPPPVVRERSILIVR